MTKEELVNYLRSKETHNLLYETPFAFLRLKSEEVALYKNLYIKIADELERVKILSEVTFQVSERGRAIRSGETKLFYIFIDTYKRIHWCEKDIKECFNEFKKKLIKFELELLRAAVSRLEQINDGSCT